MLNNEVSFNRPSLYARYPDIAKDPTLRAAVDELIDEGEKVKPSTPNLYQVVFYRNIAQFCDRLQAVFGKAVFGQTVFGETVVGNALYVNRNQLVGELFVAKYRMIETAQEFVRSDETREKVSQQYAQAKADIHDSINWINHQMEPVNRFMDQVNHAIDKSVRETGNASLMEVAFTGTPILGPIAWGVCQVGKYTIEELKERINNLPQDFKDSVLDVGVTLALFANTWGVTPPQAHELLKSGVNLSLTPALMQLAKGAVGVGLRAGEGYLNLVAENNLINRATNISLVRKTAGVASSRVMKDVTPQAGKIGFWEQASIGFERMVTGEEYSGLRFAMANEGNNVLKNGPIPSVSYFSGKGSMGGRSMRDPLEINLSEMRDVIYNGAVPDPFKVKVSSIGKYVYRSEGEEFLLVLRGTELKNGPQGLLQSAESFAKKRGAKELQIVGTPQEIGEITSQFPGWNKIILDDTGFPVHMVTRSVEATVGYSYRLGGEHFYVSTESFERGIQHKANDLHDLLGAMRGEARESGAKELVIEGDPNILFEIEQSFKQNGYPARLISTDSGCKLTAQLNLVKKEFTKPTVTEVTALLEEDISILVQNGYYEVQEITLLWPSGRCAEFIYKLEDGETFLTYLSQKRLPITTYSQDILELEVTRQYLYESINEARELGANKVVLLSRNGNRLAEALEAEGVRYLESQTLPGNGEDQLLAFTVSLEQKFGTYRVPQERGVIYNRHKQEVVAPQKWSVPAEYIPTNPNEIKALRLNSWETLEQQGYYVWTVMRGARGGKYVGKSLDAETLLVYFNHGQYTDLAVGSFTLEERIMPFLENAIQEAKRQNKRELVILSGDRLPFLKVIEAENIPCPHAAKIAFGEKSVTVSKIPLEALTIRNHVAKMRQALHFGGSLPKGYELRLFTSSGVETVLESYAYVDGYIWSTESLIVLLTKMSIATNIPFEHRMSIVLRDAIAFAQKDPRSALLVAGTTAEEMAWIEQHILGAERLGRFGEDDAVHIIKIPKAVIRQETWGNLAVNPELRVTYLPSLRPSDNPWRIATDSKLLTQYRQRRPTILTPEYYLRTEEEIGALVANDRYMRLAGTPAGGSYLNHGYSTLDITVIYGEVETLNRHGVPYKITEIGGKRALQLFLPKVGEGAALSQDAIVYSAVEASVQTAQKMQIDRILFVSDAQGIQIAYELDQRGLKVLQIGSRESIHGDFNLIAVEVPRTKGETAREVLNANAAVRTKFYNNLMAGEKELVKSKTRWDRLEKPNGFPGVVGSDGILELPSVFDPTYNQNRLELRRISLTGLGKEGKGRLETEFHYAQLPGGDLYVQLFDAQEIKGGLGYREAKDGSGQKWYQQVAPNTTITDRLEGLMGAIEEYAQEINAPNLHIVWNPGKAPISTYCVEAFEEAQLLIRPIRVVRNDELKNRLITVELIEKGEPPTRRWRDILKEEQAKVQAGFNQMFGGDPMPVPVGGGSVNQTPFTWKGSGVSGSATQRPSRPKPIDYNDMAIGLSDREVVSYLIKRSSPIETVPPGVKRASNGELFFESSAEMNWERDHGFKHDLDIGGEMLGANGKGWVDGIVSYHEEPLASIFYLDDALGKFHLENQIFFAGALTKQEYYDYILSTILMHRKKRQEVSVGFICQSKFLEVGKFLTERDLPIIGAEWIHGPRSLYNATKVKLPFIMIDIRDIEIAEFRRRIFSYSTEPYKKSSSYDFGNRLPIPAEAAIEEYMSFLKPYNFPAERMRRTETGLRELLKKAGRDGGRFSYFAQFLKNAISVEETSILSGFEETFEGFITNRRAAKARYEALLKRTEEEIGKGPNSDIVQNYVNAVKNTGYEYRATEADRECFQILSSSADFQQAPVGFWEVDLVTYQSHPKALGGIVDYAQGVSRDGKTLMILLDGIDAPNEGANVLHRVMAHFQYEAKRLGVEKLLVQAAFTNEKPGMIFGKPYTPVGEQPFFFEWLDGTKEWPQGQDIFAKSDYFKDLNIQPYFATFEVPLKH